MSRYNKVLIPTDFSEASQSAVQYAVHLLNKTEGAMIYLLFNASEPLREEEKAAYEQDFKEIKDRFPSETPIHYESIIKTGELIPSILEARAEVEANLIVMGTKGSHASEAIATSNTSELVLKADCPVLAVPDEIHHFSMKNIALAIDNKALEETDQLALLHNIARQFNAEVHVLTIENDENPIVDSEQHASTLEYYLETLNYHHTFPKNSDIEKGINDYIKTYNIDLLTLLPRIHTKYSKPSQGRLVKLLTLRTTIPLLSID
jgi:nucleotide-binding universal stress UspA family protein